MVSAPIGFSLLCTAFTTSNWPLVVLAQDRGSYCCAILP